jgi:hypothetical protein
VRNAAIVGIGLFVVTAVAAVLWQRHQESTRIVREAEFKKLFENPSEGSIGIGEELVRLQVDRFIRSLFEKDASIESIQMSGMSVRLLPPDKRKIPWLWETNATVALKFKPPNGAGAPFSATYLWKNVIQSVPFGAAGECWRETTNPQTGERSHNFYGFSEWNKEFRSLVTSEWVRVSDALEKELQREGFVSDSMRRDGLRIAKSRVAQAFGITERELQEILEAID